MTRDAQFDAGYSLAELTAALNRTEGHWGRLQRIGNDGSSSVGVYDDTTNGTKTLTLRPGPAAPRDGETVVDTGQVFVSSQPQTVTAYRS